MIKQAGKTNLIETGLSKKLRESCFSAPIKDTP